VKFYPSAADGSVTQEYYQYLQHLQNHLSRRHLLHTILPLFAGEGEPYSYQVFPYFEDFVTVDSLMHSLRLSPRQKVAVVAAIADALSELHACKVIHADLIPTALNIDRCPRAIGD
jgi:serine/threonine protein kinase